MEQTATNWMDDAVIINSGIVELSGKQLFPRADAR